MKEYICKIASIDEVITKWNYEIKKQKRKQIVWTVLTALWVSEK